MRSVLRGIVSGTQDPTVTATYGEVGWFFYRLGTAGNLIYQKQDNGVTTNWFRYGPTISLVFSSSGAATNVWLGCPVLAIPSNTSPRPVPFGCVLSGLTFTNNSDLAETDIEIYKNGTAAGNLVFTWSLTNTRTARKTDGLSAVTFAAGDRIAIFARDTGDNPTDACVDLLLSITDVVQGSSKTP